MSDQRLMFNHCSFFYIMVEYISFLSVHEHSTITYNSDSGREVQRHREAIIEKLAAQRQEQSTNEEAVISKAVAQAEAKQVRQQREQDEKKAAMLKSIEQHRGAMVNVTFRHAHR